MRYIAHTLALTLAFAVTGCSRFPHEGRPSADQQQIDADLVVDFWHWDAWRIQKPSVSDDGLMTSLTKQALLAKLDQLRLGRNFVVVILDKRDALKGKDASLEELESFFRRLGFRRVVIQQAVGGDETPILRDSAEKL